MKVLGKICAVLALSTSSVCAGEYDAAMQAFLEENIRSWASAPELITAVKAQNSENGGLAEPQIIEMDNMWRAEVGGSDTPTIDAVLNNEAAEFLRAQVAMLDGMVTEVFVMDSVGLNVAASAVTSDYWQGDEAKFTQTYPMGANGIHFSDVDFDESSQSYQAQISISLVDPDTGETIGAMTVGVLADNLM